MVPERRTRRRPKDGRPPRHAVRRLPLMILLAFDSPRRRRRPCCPPTICIAINATIIEFIIIIALFTKRGSVRHSERRRSVGLLCQRLFLRIVSAAAMPIVAPFIARPNFNRQVAVVQIVVIQIDDSVGLRCSDEFPCRFVIDDVDEVCWRRWLLIVEYECVVAPTPPSPPSPSFSTAVPQEGEETQHDDSDD